MLSPTTLICILVLALLTAGRTSAAAVVYRVEVAESLASAQVAVCVAAAREWLVFRAADSRAQDYVAELTRADGATLELDGGTVSVRDWNAGECLSYRVDVAALAAARRSGLGWNVGGDLLIAPDAWLLRPRGMERDPEATIEFGLPPGIAVSAPWFALDDAPPRRRFRLGPTPPDFPAVIGIGRFTEQDFRAGKGRVRLAIAGRLPADANSEIAEFAAAAARDVAAVFPHALAQAPQLVVIPIGSRGDAVPFGQSFRGGGPAINLFVDPSRDRAAYLRSWTLHHEFVHMLHPYLGPEGRWISEGLATWFQHVVRVRAGHESEREAWEEIEAGFERGRANRSGLSMRETSAQVERGRYYMRAYWSGTALMLLAEVEYRQRSNGAMSLALALERFAACCRARSYRMRPTAFLAEIDRIAGFDVLLPLWQAHAEQLEFPDVSPAYAALGIAVSGDAISFDASTSTRSLRHAAIGLTATGTNARVTP
jgi:hypothetical protein